MASSLLVSRLANEISSILICKRPWRGRSYYSQQHRQQHVGLLGPRLGLEACQGRVLRRRGRRRPRCTGRTAAAAANGDCSGTPSPSVSSGVSRGLGLWARAGPGLAAKRSPHLSQHPRPLPLPGPGLAPPPNFRSSARLRTGSAQTPGASPSAQLPGNPRSLWMRWGRTKRSFHYLYRNRTARMLFYVALFVGLNIR